MNKRTFVLLLLIWFGVVLLVACSAVVFVDGGGLLGWLILAGLSMIAIPACFGLGAATTLSSVQK